MDGAVSPVKTDLAKMEVRSLFVLLAGCMGFARVYSNKRSSFNNHFIIFIPREPEWELEIPAKFIIPPFNVTN